MAPDTTSDAPARAPLLQARGLACRRGRDWLFRDLSFELQPGQLVWLRGFNGSGKTTLLRTVCGLARPDEGELVWPGDAHPGGTGRVYVGHLNAMKDDLSASEALQFISRLHGGDASMDRIGQALRELGVHHRRHALVRTLSQGQRRRVALARLALETGPALWILDEPFEALDADGIAAVQALIRAHLARRGGVLLTSHLALDAGQTPYCELSLDGSARP